MNGYDRNDPYAWSRNEYAAYSAVEMARAGVDTDIIMRGLGHYSQAVVDAAAHANKNEATEKPVVKRKKTVVKKKKK